MHCALQTTDCELWTVHCRLCTANYGLCYLKRNGTWGAYLESVQYGLDYVLRRWKCLGVSNCLSVSRECHGFTNPYGLRSWVGTGWHFRTPVKPIPASQVSWVGHGCDVSSAEQLSTTTTTSSPLPLTTTTSRNLRSTACNHHGTCRRHQL